LRRVESLKDLKSRPIEERVEFLEHVMGLASAKIDDLEREVTSLKMQKQSEVVMFQ